MDPMKRVRVAVLFLLVAALLGSTTALAATKDKLTTQAKLTPTGVEPTASGSVTIKGEVVEQFAVYDVRVTCKGLSPDAAYYFWGTWKSWWGYSHSFEVPLTASAKGTAQASIQIADWDLSRFPLGVKNANGEDVLTGTLGQP